MPWLRKLYARVASRDKDPPITVAPSESTISTIPRQPALRDSAQSQSPFFSRLPAEIRLQIYALAVTGCRNIHVVDQNLRINRLPMPVEDADFLARHTRFWHYKSMYKRKGWWDAPRSKVPSILLVCSRMYNEAADYLYATRVFYFDSPTDIINLYRSTPLHLFNRITSVRFLFCSTYASPKASINIENWNTALEILCNMPNLQSCHILLGSICWKDYFSMKYSLEHGIHPSLVPLWLRDRRLPLDLEEVAPYLDWMTKLPCKGKVVVQPFRE